MSTIEKKSLRTAGKEDRNSIDLFKNESTGNISYRTRTGTEVIVVPAEGIQSFVNTVKLIEAFIGKEKLAEFAAKLAAEEGKAEATKAEGATKEINAEA